jgi:hypothetical protein
MEHKETFLQLLAKEFGWKEKELVQKASEYLDSVKQVNEVLFIVDRSRLYYGCISSQDKNDVIKTRAYDMLCKTSLPLYHQIFQQVSQQPNGMKFLVDLRSDVIVSECTCTSA